MFWEYNVLWAYHEFVDCHVNYFLSKDERKFKVIDSVPKVEEIHVKFQVVSS